MGTWSITPNELASIDENGSVHFKEHEENTEYTVTYIDDICGKISKTIIVFACEKPEPQTCTCSVTINNPIGDVGSDTPIEIGTYSSFNCEGNWSTTKTEGDDFLSDIRFSNTKILAKVSPLPEGVNSKSAKYTFSIGTCSKTVEITQKHPGTECTCNDISSIYEPKDTIFNNNAQAEKIFASYLTKGCGSVSATSSSDMFDGDIKTYSLDENFNRYDTYQENAYYYEVVGSLKENTGANRSGGVSIHLKTKGSTQWNECDKAKFYVQQCSTIYRCSDVSFGEASKTVEITANETSAYSQRMTSVTSDYAMTYYVVEGDEYVDKNGTYVQRAKRTTGTEDYFVFKLSPNMSDSPRRIEIRMYPNINVYFVNPITTSYRDSDWIGGTSCPTYYSTFVIIQKAVSTCSCDDIDVSKAKIGNISGYEYPNNKITIDSPLAGTQNITIIINEACTAFDGVEPTITSDNTDFIPNNKIKIKEYDSSKHMWHASFEYTENSGSERTATLTITFCEGKSFTATVEQVGGGCGDCVNDFKNKVTVDTTISGRCYGVSGEVIKHTSTCGVKVEVQGVTPDWLEGFIESTLSGVIRIKPDIKPNYTTRSRSFVYKVKAENLSGCELEQSYTYYQEGYKPCNKDNYLAGLIGVNDERSGQSKDVIENATITAGTVTIKTEDVLLDCVDINLSTSQPDYIDASSIHYANMTTGLTSDFKYYKKFDVVCNTKSIGSSPSQAVSIDVNTYINGEDMHKHCNLKLVINKP